MKILACFLLEGKLKSQCVQRSIFHVVGKGMDELENVKLLIYFLSVVSVSYFNQAHPLLAT